MLKPIKLIHELLQAKRKQIFQLIAFSFSLYVCEHMCMHVCVQICFILYACVQSPEIDIRYLP